MNKPTPETREQTHDLHASTTKADRASTPLPPCRWRRENRKKRGQKERERKIMKIMIYRERREKTKLIKKSFLFLPLSYSAILHVESHCSTIVYIYIYSRNTLPQPSFRNSILNTIHCKPQLAIYFILPFRIIWFQSPVAWFSVYVTYPPFWYQSQVWPVCCKLLFALFAL